MKSVCGVLFIVGIYYAIFVWMFIPMLSGIFMPEYDYQFNDIFFSVGGSINSLIGYYVWIGWAYFYFRARFPFVSSKTFWSISVVNHISWYVVFGASNREYNWNYFSNTDVPTNIWLLANIVIGVIFISGAYSGSRQNKSLE